MLKRSVEVASARVSEAIVRVAEERPGLPLAAPPAEESKAL